MPLPGARTLGSVGNFTYCSRNLGSVGSDEALKCGVMSLPVPELWGALHPLIQLLLKLSGLLSFQHQRFSSQHFSFSVGGFRLGTYSLSSASAALASGHHLGKLHLADGG